MIAQNTIDAVRDLDVVAVVEKYITLKKSGSSYKALSPFTTEKTPSFYVVPAKQIFKCFSSGKGGDAISFVRSHLNLDYPGTIKELASQFGIPIEYEEETPEKKEEREKEQSQKAAISEALNYALAWFQFNEVPKSFSKFRSFPAKSLIPFSVGYAPPGKNNFTTEAKKAGLNMAVLQAAGLVRNSKGIYYDTYQDRMIFPVFDVNNNVLSFTGRLAHEVPENAEFKPPKYINSPDSVWQKGDHLYGLNWAHKAINKMGFAYLVEGQTDVIRTHKHGLTNTVGSGGTSLTGNQCKLLHRFTDQVTIIPDNDLEKDDNPGIKAMHRNARILLNSGFAVKVLIPGTLKSRKNTDPDDWLRRLHGEEEVKKWLHSSEDYIKDYLYLECITIGDRSAKDLANQIQRMADTVESVSEFTLRTIYYDQIGAIWTPFKKKYKLKPAPKSVSLPELEILDKDELDKFFHYGFWEKGNAYYSMAQNSKEQRFTNFKIKILYFVLSDNEPQYLCIFTNVFDKRRIKAIHTDDFTSVAPFKKAIGRLGNFIFEGSDHLLNKIKLKLFNGVKEVTIPQFMGYNKTGDFFTWANGLFDGSFNKADKYGIVQLSSGIKTIEQFRKIKPESHILFNNEKFILGNPEDFIKEQREDAISQYINAGAVQQVNYYYLPFAATIKLTKDEDDIFEFEGRFRYFEKASTNFTTWAKLMVDVYGDNGKVAILYYLMALFRDIIFRENNSYVPILGLFGPRQSGKSTLARSLAWMFGEPLEDGINLESGSTTTGIRRVLSSCQNAIVFLNEYKNSLPSATIGMIKGIADGSGKLTGRNTSGNETKNYKPRSCVMLGGQDLPTQDPALFSRNIICDFDGKKRHYNAFRQLTDIEKGEQTTSVTCELLRYRSYIKEFYAKMEPAITSQLRETFEKAGMGKDAISDRMVLNFSSIITPFAILIDEAVKPVINFPFTMDTIFELFTKKARFQVEIQSSSDDVEQYLSVVTSLIGRDIFEGTHYKITKQFSEPAKLSLRVGNIHTLYRQAASRANMVIYDISSIKTYLRKHSSFVEENTGSVHFQNLPNKTSAFIFNYDHLLKVGIEFRTEMNLDETI